MSGLCSYRTEHITLIFLSYFFISFSKAKTRQSWPICQQSRSRPALEDWNHVQNHVDNNFTPKTIKPALVDWNYWDQGIFTTAATTTTTEIYDYYDLYYDAYD